MRLVLVRHGQSAWNVERRIQGHAGVGLSEVGREQSVETARWLLDTHPDAAIVSSDLQRCRETAAPIAEALQVGVTETAELRERSFGDWEGLTLAEVEQRDGDRWQRWRGGEDVVTEVGGESGPMLAARVAAALRAIVDADGHATVVVVTHGGPVWHGLHELLDLPHGSLGGVANAGISELVHDEHGWWLESWNQVAHLPVSLRTSFRPAALRSAPPVGR